MRDSRYSFGADAPLLFCYGFFLERGWTLEIINKILGNFDRTAGLFSHTLYTKAFFGFACFELFGNERRKE